MVLIFIVLALKSGADRYYFKKAQGSVVKGSEVFYYLKPKSFLSVFAFYFNYFLRKLGIIILCFLPTFTVIAVLTFLIKNTSASFNVARILFAFAIFLFLNGVFFFLRLNSFLFLSRYYFVSGRFFNYSQLFSFSYGCIEGKRGLVFKKRLSFIGWFIACLLIVPAFFVQAYYRESLAELAKDLLEN